MSKYIVLNNTNDEDDWTYLDGVDARDAEQAIKLVCGDVYQGAFVAVPERSWHPVKIEAHVQLTFTPVE